jgi:hypothetical protein
MVSALFREAERRGGVALERDDGSLAVRAHGVEVEFSLVERMQMIRLPLNDFDVRFQTDAGKRGYRNGFGPTGRLAFKVETYAPAHGKSSWEEGKDGPDLARFIGEMVQALIAACDGLVKREAAREAEKRRADAELERRALMREAKERDERRWAAFERVAVALRSYRDIEQLIHEVENSPAGEGLEDGIAWAKSKLEESYPLEKAVSILRSAMGQ